MQVSLKLGILLAALLIALGVVIGSKMNQVETLTETKIVQKDRVVTVVKEVKSPDGTITREEQRVEDRQQESQVVVNAPKDKQDWILGASYGIAIEPYYGASVHRRILGNLYLGVQVNTREEVAVGLLYSF